MKKLTIDRAAVSVLGEADAVVIGGSLAGIACALELANAGRRVWLVEPRTYLGGSVTASLRPWITVPVKGKLPAIIGKVLDGQQVEGQQAEGESSAALYPDRLKRTLEDVLQEGGVQLLYASLPVGIEKRDGRTVGVVIANKSGRQLIKSPLLMDTTETALAALLSGEDVASYAPGEEALYYRTLEFVGVDGDLFAGQAMLPVPADIGLEGGSVRLRQGYRGAGHWLLEFALKLTSANTLEVNREREVEARKAGMRLAVHLMQQEFAFRKAVLSTSSHELYGPFPLDGGSAFSGDWLDAAKTGTNGVWSLYRAVYKHGCAELLDPIGAAAAGEQLGRMLVGELAEAEEAKDAASAGDGRSAVDRGQQEGQLELGQRPEGAVTVRIPTLAGEMTGFPAVEAAAADVPIFGAVDVLVAGGGSSGACASFTAAGEGVRTALIDLNPGLGGTGTFGGVDSYWFGRKAGFAARIQDAVLAQQSELRYKGHKWNIEAKMHALLEEASRSGVQLFLNAITFGVLMQGKQVKGAVVATRWGPVALTAGAVIDATGDGDLAAFAGADYVYGSERDHTVMWYSLAQYTAPDKIQNNFTSMVDISNVLDYTRAILAGRRRGSECHDHGTYIATRESRHVKGDVVMKLSDQLLHRKWPDTINVHFSNHDVKGVSGADWVNIGLIPPNLEIEIPYRMLLPEGLDGILVAGKAVSATHDALPAIRMQADLENLGAAAALAAVQAVRTGSVLRSIDIASLQQRLADEGLIPIGTAERKLKPRAYSDADLERLVASIEAEQPLYEYSNMRMNEIYAAPIPFVEICSVGPRIVPFLVRALEQAEGLRRIHLAQALAMIGSDEAVPVLVDLIMEHLSGEKLPVRTADIMYVQLPPDHGAMPDAAFLLYSLAQTKDKRSIAVWNRITELLHPEEDDFKDTWQGLYYYIDAVCQGAERLGDPAAVPVMEAIRRIPLLRDQQCLHSYQPDYFRERRAMLELAAARALAACGSPEGYEVLIGYLSDVRSLLARQALLLLRRLSGMTYGLDPAQWTAWLADSRTLPQPRSIDLRLDVETDSETILREIL
ncbi:PBS lyase HEAT-like repeat-containing protein [Paenibacillus taihuensis]|uniref:PBS lyase HEAT-like repeat-containing protein n=1 Tax=Paenibacillus taihuensis TaxID=1156355 RepID=A0A3D9SLE5_9BACL|nr:FAD-dependent oxidoreductase [Paenibacillus taihuensis]REE92725.1 PBS lyase HEAT-like repeat-containing protein [Paenibacillus taihuensis]